MNGQSYNYSNNHSGNGTPTPSSTSYPASLSSQSSRDGSPARLPTNLNLVNNSEKILSPANPATNHYNYNPSQDSLPNSYYQTQNKVPLPTVMQKPVTQFVPSNNGDIGNEINPELYSQGYQKKSQNQGAAQPPVTTYQGNQYNTYPGNYNNIKSSYQSQATSPIYRPLEPPPLSSGPPRTNVQGIIPYTEPAISQSNLNSPKVPQANHFQKPVYAQATSPLATSQAYAQNQQFSPVAQQPQLPIPTLPTSNPSIPKNYPNQYNRPPDKFVSNVNQQYQNYNYQTTPNYQYSTPYYPGTDDVANQMSGLSVAHGYNKLWGREAIDLLKTREILPRQKVEPPAIRLSSDYASSSNCSPDIFRCTLTRIPETKALLDKSRLPLGVLIHPFKDLNQLSVIQCSAIVRCRSCRTYINPFVFFVDKKRWKCNLCFRVNDLPEEFHYDPLSKTYGDPSRRPEIKSATIEFIAPSEYMVRPPQPAAYVFVIDVSRLGAEAGYLQVFCDCLLSQLEALPGDSRTSVAFITFDSTVHYYCLAETQTQPHQMVIVDIEDMFVPYPDNLLVNLRECLGLVRDLLRELPNKYKESFDTGSALGPALQAAFKLLAATGGRITVFQSCLPNCGPGKLPAREDPSQRSGENITQVLLNPVTDFYKKLALDCATQQIALDLFILNSQFVDLASISGVSKFSGGCIHHFPLFNVKNQLQVESLQRCLQRYLCRKIGFESVMRLRCTRGLSIHTFHGNFFVRSTDLLTLPNVNPDAGFGMQVSIDENLSDIQNVCFQAALLYTSSIGERRIRVHTLCLPTASNLSDVLHSADQQCIVGLLAKMAVDRSHQSTLANAREAFMNVVADILSSYRLTQSGSAASCLMVPQGLSLLPLYILALLKHIAFRVGQSTRLDDRVYAMCQMKSLPLPQLIQTIYPDLYPVHNLQGCERVTIGNETIVQPPLLSLTAEHIDSSGVYLMDDGSSIMIYVGHNISPNLALSLFGAPSFSAINPQMTDLPDLKNQDSDELRNFVTYLQNEKPTPPTVEIIRDDSQERNAFFEKLIEDKTESGHSYYEFLQRVKVLVK